MAITQKVSTETILESLAAPDGSVRSTDRLAGGEPGMLVRAYLAAGPVLTAR
jgi:hypothetical protein